MWKLVRDWLDPPKFLMRMTSGLLSQLRYVMTTSLAAADAGWLVNPPVKSMTAQTALSATRIGAMIRAFGIGFPLPQ